MKRGQRAPRAHVAAGPSAWNLVVPEFTALDLPASLRFWIDLLAFRVVYARDGFAFLERGGSARPSR